MSGATVASHRTRDLPVLPSSAMVSPRQSPAGSTDATPSTTSAAANNAPSAHLSSSGNRATAVRANGSSAESGPSNNSSSTSSTSSNNNSSNAANHTIGAAAAAHQPKVVQTAFIHKLYNMLEDSSIQHLISWSSTNDSFVMSPTSEFSKVLSQYFKHTNISSFVRQLNMYGFHKVSDVFHTGSPDSALWEFKHGNGNFKRGDLVGLREIKRRASRHALIHRDSFAGHRPSSAMPGTPAETIPDTSTEMRFVHLENSLFSMHNRLTQTEERNAALNSKCQALANNMSRCYFWNCSIAHALSALIPDRESPLYRDVCNMQAELEKHLENVRGLEQPHDSFVPGRQSYLHTMPVDHGPPVSPRQVPQDDGRRQSVADAPRPMIRPPVPPHLATPRRYGSIGNAHSPSAYSRSPVYPPVNPQQHAQQHAHAHPHPQPHPLSHVSSPPGLSLGRRHTSADIRQHGWPPPGGVSSLSSNMTGGPNHATNDQHLQDVLAQYEIRGSRHPHNNSSRHVTPPFNESVPPTFNFDSSWLSGNTRFPRHESSLPATRRSSMASNVHSLLNPKEDYSNSDDRKRRRMD